MTVLPEDLPPLTYDYLAGMAVTPPSDSYDNTTGAYSNSPLGEDVGLHIHTPDDTWNEAEPSRPVHFVVRNTKIAAVYPDGVMIFAAGYGEPYQTWINLLKSANIVKEW